MGETSFQKGTKPIKLIAAACNNMGIGRNGCLPWNLPKEYKYFIDKITSVTQPGKKNLIVLGRFSFESFDERYLPLPNCIIALLSRKESTLPPHASHICRDEEDVLKLASTPPLCNEVETIWILGGAEYYKTMMQHPWCDEIYLTRVQADFECDTFFPEVNQEIYKLMENFPGVPSEVQEENGLSYVFQVYKRAENIKRQ
ncbi:dihydrofolate reductase-like [Spea bombifrons]|uniref:dihydrofolate reductase-like n=1 Tax=Spea bombifrons TaxID=233779 RepID=UPI00234A2D80|nr:dihydrofolate reductase-like [Spea bombifrons]XP_053321659.1 dihydrofolate reductase-like [Spea bombifrons]